MAEPSIDIDRVVREVLAKLDFAPPEGDTDGELVVSARVVTLSDVEGRLEKIRRLVVPPRAVITPAVRDELIRRNVALAYASPESTGAAVASRLVLVATDKRFDPTPLLGALRSQGIDAQQHRCDCLIAATDRLAGEITQPRTLGVLLTRHVAAGLCLANRLRGVRAVSGIDDVDSVGANLLVLDPAAVSMYQLRQIVGSFCRAGVRQCPEALRERLA